jgi:hypothetical protein
MIVVSASLTAIALIGLAIGDDVLFADTLQRDRTDHFNECNENGFQNESCQPYEIHMKYEQCVAEKALDDPSCYRYRTWVESAIFEECRENRDVTSPLCQKYEGLY